MTLKEFLTLVKELWAIQRQKKEPPITVTVFRLKRETYDSLVQQGLIKPTPEDENRFVVIVYRRSPYSQTVYVALLNNYGSVCRIRFEVSEEEDLVQTGFQITLKKDDPYFVQSTNNWTYQPQITILSRWVMKSRPTR